jgi:hypothetical protein
MTGLLLPMVVVASAAAPEVVRDVVIPRPGRVAVTLDRDVYDVARRDLADLRIVDDRGGVVPYVLERGAETWRPVTPRLVDRGFRRGVFEVATFDFRERLWKRDLKLDLSGDNFRRRVVVEGSDDAREWVALTDGAYVFAVPGPPAARYETVRFPENEQRYLRVTVEHGAGDPERTEIRGAQAVSTGRREAPAVALELRHVREEDPRSHETLVTLELGARSQPFRAVALDIADPRFMRGVVVEAREDPLPAKLGEIAQPFVWRPIGEGCVYRYVDAGRRIESASLAVVGRDRILRLRIRNRDDRPLDIRGVAVTAPLERLLFEAETGRQYRFTYGSPRLGPPAYDLVRTIGDQGAWAASATEAHLGVPERRSEAVSLPWTERYPALLWTGLLVAVGTLGALTWRSLRTSG